MGIFERERTPWIRVEPSERKCLPEKHLHGRVSSVFSGAKQLLCGPVNLRHGRIAEFRFSIADLMSMAGSSAGSSRPRMRSS